MKEVLSWLSWLLGIPVNLPHRVSICEYVNFWVIKKAKLGQDWTYNQQSLDIRV